MQQRIYSCGRSVCMCANDCALFLQLIDFCMTRKTEYKIQFSVCNIQTSINRNISNVTRHVDMYVSE